VMERVSVERVAEGGLERRVWEFSVLEFPAVHLEYFAEQSRKTRRHKWVVTGRVYSRLQMDRHAPGTRIREEPDVPDDVMADGMGQMRARLEFRKWRRG
jgi:hypothetical protein